MFPQKVYLNIEDVEIIEGNNSHINVCQSERWRHNTKNKCYDTEYEFKYC